MPSVLFLSRKVHHFTENYLRQTSKSSTHIVYWMNLPNILTFVGPSMRSALRGLLNQELVVDEFRLLQPFRILVSVFQIFNAQAVFTGAPVEQP
jgi:hypothetical protein